MANCKPAWLLNENSVYNGCEGAVIATINCQFRKRICFKVQPLITNMGVLPIKAWKECSCSCWSHFSFSDWAESEERPVPECLTVQILYKPHCRVKTSAETETPAKTCSLHTLSSYYYSLLILLAFTTGMGLKIQLSATVSNNKTAVATHIKCKVSKRYSNNI